MVETLQRLDGVAEVKSDVIPDHLLIDHDGRRGTAEDFVVLLNELGSRGNCRAALMQSCITAGDPRGQGSAPER
jgi:hypothetical protein